MAVFSAQEVHREATAALVLFQRACEEDVPLPCWEHLESEQYRQNVAEFVAGIEARAAAEREASGERNRPRHDTPQRISTD
jgi:hypothetical protein